MIVSHQVWVILDLENQSLGSTIEIRMNQSSYDVAEVLCHRNISHKPGSYICGQPRANMKIAFQLLNLVQLRFKSRDATHSLSLHKPSRGIIYYAFAKLTSFLLHIAFPSPQCTFVFLCIFIFFSGFVFLGFLAHY